MSHAPPSRVPGLPRRLVAVALAFACLLPGGCLRRRLTVRSNPPGAQVFVDDQEIGATPCSASFVYYGTRKITVMKDGYRTETVFQKISPPWYEIPPLDFVTENLWPRETRDERIVDLELVPEEVVPPERLLERAQALRDSARTGTVTPLVAGEMPPSTVIEQRGLPGQGLPGGQPMLYEPLPAPPGPSPLR